MTKVVKKKVKCAECGTESEQMIVYSINLSLGHNADNEKLMIHQQVCPNCKYSSADIEKVANK